MAPVAASTAPPACAAIVSGFRRSGCVLAIAAAPLFLAILRTCVRAGADLIFPFARGDAEATDLV